MATASKHKTKKINPNITRIRRLKRLEEFVEKQIERYVKIHKKHEKEITYIQ
ncbi:MAG: hypothetical protein HYW23_04435 [Candidatus Aenigmarchaeota archaeon]|nr:hypothetical protein [Candidatus Aenigmarchaeota archaeon]